MLALAMISSGVMLKETKMDKRSTAIIGKIDAKVTTPNPDNDESPFPAEAAIPIPRDKTKGTVTGPVVTAPQSHARPRIVLKSGFDQMKDQVGRLKADTTLLGKALRIKEKQYDKIDDLNQRIQDQLESLQRGSALENISIWI